MASTKKSAKKTQGKKEGGFARARSMSAEARAKIAKDAAASRWTVPKATHAGKLRIGDVEIDCAVLPGGMRVLSQRAVGRALGRSYGGADYRKATQEDAGGKLPVYLATSSIKPFISNELLLLVSEPIVYRHNMGGGVAYGLPATALPLICDVWLKAREAGSLDRQDQKDLAQRAEILMRGLAHVGIIALVDEATGFQRDRAKDALTRILEEFIAKELQPYVPTFPADYYQEMFRLRGLEFPKDSVKRPQYFGNLTNDIVYRRLAPGVLDELKRVTPKLESGRYKNKLFQKLTANLGYPKLREHLGSVVTIMKLSSDWHEFMATLDRIHKRHTDQLSLNFEYKKDEDSGKGL